jgi:hypothetical protein
MTPTRAPARFTDDRDFLTVAAVTGQPVRLVTGTS